MWFRDSLHGVLLFLSAIAIPENELRKIGEKIWENESHRNLDKLLFWNAKETFPSLGIGHFIWYHEKQQAPFEETFPKLIQFLITHQAEVPDWLHRDQHCPWKSREEFLSAQNDPKMQQLRALLFKTIDLQSRFMLERFKDTEQQIIQASENPQKMKALFQKLAKNAKGNYALIDYTNFKGTGLSQEERYKNEGWGLLQVLQNMNENAKDPITEFVNAAKKVLEKRVRNAPIEKQEDKWLNGWNRRLDTYLSF